MPITKLDSATWRDLAAHADALDALTTRLRAIQAQSVALLAAERAAIDEMRALRDALHSTHSAALASLTPDGLEDERAALAEAHRALAQSVAHFLPKMEHAASEEAITADPSRINLDVMTQGVASARAALVDRL